MTVTVSGLLDIFTATSTIEFVSGDALAKLGLSVETVSAQGNGTPLAVMTYDLAGVNGDNSVRVLTAGVVDYARLVIADGSSMTKFISDQLRDYAIISDPVTDHSIEDNQ